MSTQSVLHALPVLQTVNEKHVKFDQGLDVFTFCQGNQRNIEERSRTSQSESISNENKGKVGYETKI